MFLSYSCDAQFGMFEDASSFSQDLCGWEIDYTIGACDFCNEANCGSCFTNAAFLIGYHYSIMIFSVGIAFVLHS